MSGSALADRPSAQLFALNPPAPPINLQAEMSLLGALLANNSALERVSGFLRPEHFADAVNGLVYDTILRKVESGQLADVITLRTEFQNAGLLQEVGGAEYLVQLLGSMVGIINAPEYGRAIFDCWMRRQVIDVAERLRNSCFGHDSGVAASVALASAMMELEQIGDGGSVDRPVWAITEAVDEAMRRADAVSSGKGDRGLMMGMQAVDEVLGGLDPGTLTVVGGRPGSGKSSLALQWALHLAMQDPPVPVAYFSLEMSEAALGRRCVSVISGVPLAVIRRGEHGRFEDEVMAARRKIAGKPLYIDGRGGLSIAQIATKARMLKRRFGIRLIIVDHMHLVKGERDEVRAGGPTFVVTQVSHGLQAMAKNLDVPVIALAQLNRGVEGREDKRPTKADLRQAGAIEEDADNILFVHRPELYVSRTPPERGEHETAEAHANKVTRYEEHRRRVAGIAELIFEKTRDGEPLSVNMRFQGATTSFSAGEVYRG